MSMKWHKTFYVIVVITVLSLLLCGCEPAIKNGEVYKKKYTPAHSETVFVPIITTNGKTTTTTMIPMCYYYSDDYAVFIKSNDGSGATAVYHVEKDIYDQIEIGSEFEWDRDTCRDSAKYTRERAE